ncbi:LLM class F420-dependent oxidoreductase [Chloroflexota bacterium]
MKIGIVYPQTEFGSDPAAIKAYAQTAEALGYTHVLAYDHVLGANPDRPGGWQGPYTYEDDFIEIFSLFSYMAGVTESLGFITGVLILPQRETALAAKQAATLDVLCGGQFRLGVGIGWNQVEYTALNQDFSTRGRRVEEQVAVLRALWKEPLVTYRGEWHQIPDAGLKPLPVRGDIPIWFGGSHDNVLRRIATIGDGWLPNFRQAEEAKPYLERIAQHAEAAGRSMDEIGLEPRLMYGDGDPDAWAKTMSEWEAVGATHISLNTMGAGLETAAEHLAAVRHFAETIKV